MNVAPGDTSRAAEPTYEAAWREYRRRLTHYSWASRLFLLPCLLLAFFCGTDGVSQMVCAGAAIFALSVFVVAILITQIRLLVWRCPQCGKRFAHSWFRGTSAFAHLRLSCLHCGTPIDS
ncbi:MAG: hypothetical protein HN742_02770 [Lentisphaerae bacterium]|jgi:hypothetical protein|nr:hypothetical protein [Lentisphaerota bacterium]MBT5607489.1 hypothetical protein [Lentisphaerota bacterium]MBT7059920.1 hypothetical protein [Lentisphaerota bacterium]MBT7840762.1 hypothetical protein [Lentisphaerota bacterium]